MAADPISLAIGTTLFGAASSGYSAIAQNRAASRSARSQRQAAAVQEGQLASQTAQDLENVARERAQMIGRIRVAAGAAGTVVADTSYGALVNQAGADASLNSQILQQNYQNNVANVRSGLNANLDRLRAGVQSPLLNAISGGLQGLGTGLQIGQAGLVLRREGVI